MLVWPPGLQKCWRTQRKGRQPEEGWLVRWEQVAWGGQGQADTPGHSLAPPSSLLPPGALGSLDHFKERPGVWPMGDSF